LCSRPLYLEEFEASLIYKQRNAGYIKAYSKLLAKLSI